MWVLASQCQQKGRESISQKTAGRSKKDEVQWLTFPGQNQWLEYGVFFGALILLDGWWEWQKTECRKQVLFCGIRTKVKAGQTKTDRKNNELQRAYRVKDAPISVTPSLCQEQHPHCKRLTLDWLYQPISFLCVDHEQTQPDLQKIERLNRNLQ